MRAKATKPPRSKRRPGSLASASRDERGASAVEFALVASLLFMVVLGMISGGLAYSRKLALIHAAREGVRYGATLGTGNGSIPDSWFEAVAKRTIDSATGDLAETWGGQYVCVAYVGYGSPATSSEDRTRTREKFGTNPAQYKPNPSINDSNTWCFDDGRGNNGNERRVQVLVRRNTKFEALLWGTTLTLRSDSVGRFEVTPPS